VRAIGLLVATSACGRIFGSAPADSAGDAVALDPSLIGWWKLDEGSGTAVADSTPNGNAGVTVGGTWMPGRTPSSFALSLDGIKDHEIDLSDPPVLHVTASATLSAWVMALGFHTGSVDDTIVSRSNFSAGDTGWELKVSPDCGGINFVLEIAVAGTNAPERCSNTTVATGVWYHVAGVYDAAAQTMDIYVDGMPDNAALLGGPVPATQNEPANVHAQIGNGDPVPPRLVGGIATWNGLLSDVRIYDRALSPNEIATIAK
jgi:hypothetical protein